MTTKIIDKPIKLAFKIRVIFIAIKPLKISSISVISPSLIPPVLNTFVAPIFLDPILRGSSLLKIYDMIRPNGIEPFMEEKNY